MNPLLMVLGLTGFHRCGRAFGGNWLTARSVAAGSLFGLLGLWSVAANLALAIEYQRLIAPVDPETRDEFVARQYEGGTIERVSDHPGAVIEDLPVGERGDIALVGDPCRVWWTDGFGWVPLDAIDGDDRPGTFCFALRIALHE